MVDVEDMSIVKIPSPLDAGTTLPPRFGTLKHPTNLKVRTIITIYLKHVF